MNKNLSRMNVLACLIAIAPAVALAMGNRPVSADEEAANVRIQPVAKTRLAPTKSSLGSGSGNRSGEELYKIVCGACHETGVSGAPRTGDKAAWVPRIGVGLDVLTKTALAGKGAMPPKGGSDATQEELTRAIVFMANKSGASFKEPVAGTKPAISEKNAKEIASATCHKCHETGEQGAPRISDKSAWTQRVSKGFDAVTRTVIRGHGNMPARGGLSDLTDDELKEVISVLLKEVGAE